MTSSSLDALRAEAQRYAQHATMQLAFVGIATGLPEALAERAGFSASMQTFSEGAEAVVVGTR